MQPVIFKPTNTKRFVRMFGFTLIELMVSIVVSAISLTFLTSLFFSSASKSVEPALQIRAAEFAQALMDEILAKPYDELSPVGGVPPCSSCSGALGTDGAETRATFNDVDDYNFYCDNADPFDIENSLGNSSLIGFSGYKMSVCVVYDGNYDGIADSDTNAKQITVSIYTPLGAGLSEPITIKAYRGNF